MSPAPLPLPTPSDLAIRVRDWRFGRRAAPARWWLGGDPVATAWHNALSATFPRGEAFFIAAVKAHRKGAPAPLATARLAHRVMWMGNLRFTTMPAITGPPPGPASSTAGITKKPTRKAPMAHRDPLTTWIKMRAAKSMMTPRGGAGWATF